MSTDKYRELARTREKVARLRKDPHLQFCDCCRWDLDLVDEDPLSSIGRVMLRDVEKRCELADARASR